MSDPEGLLDTSVVLALHAITNASDLPEVALISAVTLAELSVGPLVAADDVERARRLATVQQVEADFDPIPFDASAARSFDAMIAATALANGLPLYTANPDDFAGIDGLVLRPVSASGRGG